MIHYHSLYPSINVGLHIDDKQCERIRHKMSCLYDVRRPSLRPVSYWSDESGLEQSPQLTALNRPGPGTTTVTKLVSNPVTIITLLRANNPPIGGQHAKPGMTTLSKNEYSREFLKELMTWAFVDKQAATINSTLQSIQTFVKLQKS